MLLLKRCALGEKARRLAFQRFADHKAVAHKLFGGDPHSCSHLRFALQQAFAFQALRRLGHRQHAHAQLGGQLPAGYDGPQRQLAP